MVSSRPTKPSEAPSSTPKAARGTRVRPVPAVSRTIAILRLLGDTKQPMGVKAIADALELIPSTCLHILRVLVSEGLVTVDPSTKRYALGSGMISLARSVLGGGSFAQLVQPALDRLAAHSGVTAMGVEVTGLQTAVVLALSRSDQPFRFHTDVGSQFNSLVSATGRLIAAHNGETWAQLRKRFDKVEWDNAPTFDQWKDEIEQARALGWSVDRDHFISGVTVVAVPVMSQAGRMTHTLAAVGLSSHLDGSAVNALAARMLQEARQLAGALP
ncbi:IclR family transcriptional regulator [Diaphorobacter caeni]|uniref:IclR family transcriptional regulator n=1 Tax=Diaphorobacter caeni TaxID=2784387 RepID=UPI0018907C76|nr:IclR family transcriptional regulator [Diaphorobacter caeni]MBF5004982.1 IclR family transcriptional regulator [Diaphorobacter caeni]